MRHAVALLVACAIVVPGACIEWSFDAVELPVTLRADAIDVDGVDAIEVVVASVALRSCDRSAWLRLPAPLVSAALAHTTSAPTVIGVPHVVDLLAATELTLGVMEPPTGCWDRVELEIGPADEDAVGIVDTERIVGASATIVRDDGTVTISTLRHTLSAPLVDEDGEAGVRLRADDAAELHVSLRSALQPDALLGVEGYEAGRAVVLSLSAEAQLRR